MTAGVTHAISAEFPMTMVSRYGGGRGGPAKSGVGQPFEGAVTLALVPVSRPGPPPAPTAGRPSATARPRFGPRPTFLYSLTSDGTLHSMYVSNGDEPEPGLTFLPAHASVSDFSVVDGVAYATTINNCGGVADGLWALDLESKAAASWHGAVTGGESAFSPNGETYVTSGSKLMALDAKTLAPGASYEAGQAFSSAPLVFEYKTKAMVAAATQNGVIHLLDTAALGNAAAKSPAGDAEPYALASWETVAGTRWIIATSAKSITAWKVIDKDGNFSLQQSWSVKGVPSPASPLVINGVLFALERGDSSHNSVLYAFDATSGKALWNSGSTLTSFVPKFGGLAAGGSSLYLGTHDGTLWDFGFPIEH